MRAGRTILYAATLYVAVFLQSSVARYLEIAFVAPDLFLVILIGLSLFCGSHLGGLFGLIGGLALDVLGIMPIGYSALQYALIGTACGLLARNRFVDRLVIPTGLAAMAFAALQFVDVTYLYLNRAVIDWAVVLWKAAIGTAYTALIELAAYQVFHLIFVLGPLKPTTHGEQ